ncbi:isochorismatase family protein [Demequina sp. SYSU T00192]|uniref:Isochorismatase family protein n=1 Tax=Demequina litoralis TaxID=3051660 RepID=A0ABT8G8C7_9MICO|nr:isochorismatase family protein [Demequina sp. SYSU T00192]MDN4475386.1 isochorismatase family protein [Demequina sp. SYSU T00192]
MTTLEGRAATAVLVIDMQRDVVADAVDRDGTVARIAALVARARASGVAVVWVQDTLDGAQGSDGWGLVDALAPHPGEPVVAKEHGDAFEDTDLERALAALGAGRLVVCGAQTDACVRSTIHGAFARGYDVTLVEDGHTTVDHSAFGAPPPAQVIAHTNLYWRYQSGPGKRADVVPAARIVLATP